MCKIKVQKDRFIDRSVVRSINDDTENDAATTTAPEEMQKAVRNLFWKLFKTVPKIVCCQMSPFLRIASKISDWCVILLGIYFDFAREFTFLCICRLSRDMKQPLQSLFRVLKQSFQIPKRPMSVEQFSLLGKMALEKWIRATIYGDKWYSSFHNENMVQNKRCGSMDP